MRWTALLIVLTLPLASDAGEMPRREQPACLFGCRCGDRDNGQQTAILMQILQNQQQIIALLSQQNRGDAPIIQQSQPPVVINMPGPRGELAPGAPKGEIPGGAPKGDIPGGPPKGGLPGGPPKGDIPGGAPRGEIPVNPTMPPAVPPSVPGVREGPGGELPSTPPASVSYQTFSNKRPYYPTEPAWKPVPRSSK